MDARAVAALCDEFRAQYGSDPRWIAAAPGRVNLIGEHTDYNDGFVLPMAIDRYTMIAAAPSGSDLVTFRSDALEGMAVVDLSRPVVANEKCHWANYPKGVLAGFLQLGLRPPGFSALIRSTVPLGSGLSSSAALLVATATLLEALVRESLDPMRKVLLCQKAEHDFARVPSGIMDHCISVLGREGQALLLDCRSHAAEWVPMSDPAVSVLIINTNVKHDLASGEYGLRRAQCMAAVQALGARSLREVSMAELEDKRGGLDAVTYRRARHAVSEIARTCEAAELFRNGDWVGAGRLMYASHASLRDDYEVSCPELDTVVNIAREIGVERGLFGCRMTGGGFGGCAVALVTTSAKDEIASRLSTEYLRRTGIQSTLFVSRPASGASVCQV